VGSEFVFSVPKNRMHSLRNSLSLPLVAKDKSNMINFNNKGGRPLLDSAVRRRHTVKTLLTDKEYDKFKRDASESGMTPSRYLRKLISGVEIKEALSPEERIVQRGLHKLGQLMVIFYRKTPSCDRQAYGAEFRRCVDGLNSIIDYFNEKL